MKLKFVCADFDYVFNNIMLFQNDDISTYWSHSLYANYNELNEKYALSLPFEQRKEYLYNSLLKIYNKEKNVINNKVVLFSKAWNNCEDIVCNALTSIFNYDCKNDFNNMKCYVSLNPIEPRFLKEQSFDMFYRLNEKDIVLVSLHEIIHFVWFTVWNKVFKDDYSEYETPSLKWVLSEMVIDCVMNDDRLKPIFNFIDDDNKQFAYQYFYNMKINGENILLTLRKMYNSQNIEDFMRNSYNYCLKYENEIYNHIENEENSSEVVNNNDELESTL